MLTVQQSDLVLTHATVSADKGPTLTGQLRWSAAGNEVPVGLLRHSDDSVLALSKMPICAWCTPASPGPSTTRVRQFDLGEMQGLHLTKTTDVMGNLVEARRIGNQLYLITQIPVNLPPGVLIIPKGVSPNPDSPRWREAVDQQVTTNAKLLESTPLSFWFDQLRLPTKEPGDRMAPTQDQCQRFIQSSGGAMGWLRVTRIDLQSGDRHHQTVLTGGKTIYLSARSLIIASAETRLRGISNSSTTFHDTDIHQFSVKPAGQLQYKSSARLAGRVIDRYAISERDDGTLRLVLTKGFSNARTRVLALHDVQGELKQVGQSPILGARRPLSSARFLQDRAYIDTAGGNQTYTAIDVADPTNMTVLDFPKREIPGQFLQAIGDDRLLLIGWRFTAAGPPELTATLYDLSAPTGYRELHKLEMGRGYSVAISDPKAIMVKMPQTRTGETLIGIPVRHVPNQYKPNINKEASVRWISVSPTDIRLRGQLDMTDLYLPEPSYDIRHPSAVSRTGLVGDILFGISNHAIRSTNIGGSKGMSKTLLVK